MRVYTRVSSLTTIKLKALLAEIYYSKEYHKPGGILIHPDGFFKDYCLCTWDRVHANYVAVRM